MSTRKVASLNFWNSARDSHITFGFDSLLYLPVVNRTFNSFCAGTLVLQVSSIMYVLIFYHVCSYSVNNIFVGIRLSTIARYVVNYTIRNLNSREVNFVITLTYVIIVLLSYRNRTLYLNASNLPCANYS